MEPRISGKVMMSEFPRTDRPEGKLSEELISAIVNRLLDGGLVKGNSNKTPVFLGGSGRLNPELLRATFDPDTLVKCNLDNTFCVRSDYKLGRRTKPELALPACERFSHFKERFRSGWTLASDAIERNSLDALALCQKISETFGYICRANLYITPPNTRGFPPHFDSHDVLVFHIIGRKKWTIETSRRLAPRRQIASPPGLNIEGESLSVVLEPGDMLFIPKGHAHVVDNYSEEIGAQLTLACTSIILEDILLQCVADQLETIGEFSENFPSFSETGDVATATTALARLAEGVFRADVSDLIRRVREHHFRQTDSHSNDDLLES
jgi:Cupin superfamily protein